MASTRKSNRTEVEPPLAEWMPKPDVARLLRVSRQAVYLQAEEFTKRHKLLAEKIVETKRLEGGRIIKREMEILSISAIFSIAINTRKYEVADRVQVFATANGIQLILLARPKKEYEFSELIECFFPGVEIERQYLFDGYSVDFFIPAYSLAIEYDENYHKRTKTKSSDALRQERIENSRGIKFIRVSEGKELDGIREISKSLFEKLQLSPTYSEARSIRAQ